MARQPLRITNRMKDGRLRGFPSFLFLNAILLHNSRLFREKLLPLSLVCVKSVRYLL